MTVPGILETIVAQRRRRIEASGPALGRTVPERRRVPLVPFPEGPFIICEIKRRSPSAGEIRDLKDPEEQAAAYVRGGIGTISVLTEEDHFGGSLNDLITLKQSHPRCCFLRKDFLLEPEDIDISYRAGADAVLLIAAILDTDTLEMLYRIAKGYGMEVLVEVHTAEEVRRIRQLAPDTVGINARNLKDFSIDLLTPLVLKELLDWNPKTIFESGIRSGEHASLAFTGGFDALLVGEAVMRDPGLLRELQVSAAADEDRLSGSFWSRLCKHRIEHEGLMDPETNQISSTSQQEIRGSRYPLYRPLIKICGLTREEDAKAAEELGADILGFVFAPSPRRAEPELLRRIGPAGALKAAVVVLKDDNPDLPEEVKGLLEDGLIDVLQFHGDESPEKCASFGFPYYKALRIRNREDIAGMKNFRSPRVLTDAYTSDAYGGTGRCINADLIPLIAGQGPLWIAGGIGPQNVARLINAYQPELIDASSSLESAPGRKDHEMLKDFFSKIDRASQLVSERRNEP